MSVTSVNEAMRELREGGECAIDDPHLVRLVVQVLDSSDIRHSVYKHDGKWIIEQEY
jgi:HD-GYP domain-containing protein (c-di-GMP phosphodiesterase class II)